MNPLGRSLFVTSASAAALSLSMTVTTAEAETYPVQTAVVIQPSASSGSRPEIVADFIVWRAAGMLAYQADGANVFGARYQHDYANYVAVRSSPQFAVIQRAVEHGQTPNVVLTDDPLRVSIAGR